MNRILVVEDSKTQAQQLRLVLESEFEVELAPDGQRGLDLFNASPFDAVLTDVVMPGMTGYELCHQIKSDPAKRHVPVILLTTLSDPISIVNGIECGADYFIPKPYQAADLVERLKTLLSNRALRSANRLKVGVEVVFLGRQFTITAEKEQILDLLLSTCEEIVHSNRELQDSQEELRAAKAKVEEYNHRLREQVRSSEEKYRTLMEQANDANFILDPAGKVLEVNRRAEVLLGQPGVAILGRSFEDLVPPGTDRPWFGRFLAGDSARVDNVPLQRAQGRAAAVDLSASRVEVGGERFILVIAHDVTERNRLEEQFRQAQKMEAVGLLAGGVAHDFNNLLTIIHGYSEVVLGTLPDEHPSRPHVAEIRKAGERAAALTRQLLIFGRQQVLSPQVLDLNAVIDDLEKMLQRVIGEDIDLKTNLYPALGHVKSDPGQIEQVVMNLAVNARDAMPRGGKLTIETRNAYLDETYCRSHSQVRPGPYVMLAISDTGCGMSDEVKARIFEPFFTTKEKGKGTGLGLAMVFGVIKQSCGHIEVYTEPGLGTTFRIYLPRTSETIPEGKSWHGLAPAPSGTETILLVEDEEAVRALAKNALEDVGYTVLEAGHGIEAVQLATQHRGPIHLLVSDVIMPQLGGRQLAEQLLALHPDLKVLFLSGYTDDAVVRHGILEAEVNFLQKPFSLVALAHKVREVLDAPASSWVPLGPEQ